MGNKLEVGIFDHHDNGYESTAQVLADNIELLKQTVENLIPEEKIRFTTYFKPDMDALVSIFLFKEYIEKGDFLNNKGLRRDYSKSRGENPDSIFKKVPFVETEDTWYISDKEDMIDVPKKHRDLSYSELIEVVENITDMVEATYLVEIDRTIEKSLSVNVPVSKTGVESLFQWNARLTEALGQDMDKKYKLAIVRIGAGLIMQSCECKLNSQTSLDIYQYIKQILGLDEHKSSVTDSMNLVSEHKKERLYGTLSLLSKWAIPFAFISTFVNMEILQLPKLFKMGKDFTGVSWCVAGVAIVLFVIVFVKLISQNMKKPTGEK